MAKKSGRIYICSQCGAEHPRWVGRCSDCGAWNTVEERALASTLSSTASMPANAYPPLSEMVSLADVDEWNLKRFSTCMGGVDLVLGGGIVPGAFLLLAGEPGVGKSTLLLELARQGGISFYYFSGEESPGQIRLRAQRMGLPLENIQISHETFLEAICDRILKDRPALCVIDSIQTVRSASGGSAPGSPGQLREASLALMDVARRAGSAVLVTGHMTKDGAVAGPKLLEHMVDGVLYFETDRTNHKRILRAVKNRFGSVGELAIFHIHNGGLSEVVDYTTLPDDHTNPSGRVYSALSEGSRAIGVEVQSLVVRSSLGQARRMADGIDSRRLILISAVLEKYLKMNLSEMDIFVNLAGGLSADDPGLDLAMAAAVISSYSERPVGRSAFLGELSLTGEIRPAGDMVRKIKELNASGVERIYLPVQSKEQGNFQDLSIVEVGDVQSLLYEMNQRKVT